MKKTKLLALLSVLMIAAMLLSSCGFAKRISKVSSFEKVLNKDYKYAEDVVSEAKTLTELNDYTVVKVTDEFVLLSSLDEEDLTMTYKVFSYRAASVILTLANTEKTTYMIDLDDAPAFVVTKLVVDEETETTTYTAYDATGAELISTKHAFDAPSEYADLILYANTLYSVADNGKMTKALDVPENLKKSEPDFWNDEYFYFFDDDGGQVFDRSLNYVSAWYAPSSVEEITPFVLNNGDVLVQYTTILDKHAEKYDYYETDENGETVKYELTTKLITAKNGKAKDLKMDYVIESLYSVYMFEEWFDEQIFAEKVENLATICPIVDQRVDDSEAAMDLVLMNNKGKIGKSVKLVDDQEAYFPPQLVGDGIYYVDTLHGDVLTDAKGEILLPFYNYELEIVGKYIVGEYAIYDLSMNKVYDLLDNHATVMTTMGNTVFVMAGEDITEKYQIIAFCGGEQKTLVSFDAENENNKLFMPIANADVYAIYDEATEEYTYYNADGKELVKTKALLAVVKDQDQGYAYDVDSVLLTGVDGETVVFYVLTK